MTVIKQSSSKPALQQQSRRRLVGNFCRGSTALLASSLLSGPGNGSERLQDHSHMPLQHLIQSLRKIGKEVCLQEANRLAGQLSNKETTRRNFHLHLRGAALDVSDAQTLANALHSLSAKTAAELHSFSVSYNSVLQQAGIVALVNSLPVSLTELGMVGCDMDDKSAEALLSWATRATLLKVICIEENRLSAGVKKRFTELREHKKDLLVVV